MVFWHTLPTPFPLFYTYLNIKNTYEAIKVDDLRVLLSNKFDLSYSSKNFINLFFTNSIYLIKLFIKIYFIHFTKSFIISFSFFKYLFFFISGYEILETIN